MVKSVAVIVNEDDDADVVAVVSGDESGVVDDGVSANNGDCNNKCVMTSSMPKVRNARATSSLKYWSGRLMLF